MPIHDLLWACPNCGRLGGLRPARGGEVCSGCGASFRRGRGASIEARLPDGRTLTRAPAEWTDMLPAEPPTPADAGNDRQEGGAAAGAVVRSDAVLARFAIGEEPIRLAGKYQGSMERLSEPIRGTLSLADATLELRLDDGSSRIWLLDDLSALQASSGTVQIRPKAEPIVSFEFPDSSARLWEESIAAALRRRWTALGRGDIVEFQPRIVGSRKPAARARGAAGS